MASRAPIRAGGWRLTIPVLGLCLAAGAVAGPALAAPSGTVTVGPSAEAWYRATPACALPTGCVDLGENPAPFPPETLHIGVMSGQEQARTYVQLNLGALPSGASPSGGTLLLPVASMDDGTRAPETAKLQACAVKAPVQEADGSFAPPPEVDCETASEAATFRAAAGDEPAVFTVDLTALTSAWEGGAQSGALALLPAEETAPTDNWRVVLSQRERTGDDVMPISASLSFGSSSDDFGAGAPPVAPAPIQPAPAFESAPFESAPFESAPFESAPFESAPFDFETGTSFEAPLSIEAPPAPEPEEQAVPAPEVSPVAQQVLPVASFLPSGFRYPAVFLLPLLLALGVGYTGRALTQDLVGARP